MNCSKICPSDQTLICDRPQGHSDDHHATTPKGSAEWPEGWGVTVGIPAGGPLPDPNVP